MTNEWGPPLTGEEMKALKGRIDPSVWLLNGLGYTAQYGPWHNSNVFDLSLGWSLPANHPYYKVREYNQKHGTNLVLHDGSGKEPKDWDEDGRCLYRDGGVWWIDTGPEGWAEIIAYTPKPKESEVLKEVPQVATVIGDPQIAEQMPRDEAIEYVCAEYFGYLPEKVKDQADQYEEVIEMARLIQQYEPDRLKSAVDIAAEAYAAEDREVGGLRYICSLEGFKAGAAWQKENG